MREIDRATTERFGVPSLTLMENAGVGSRGLHPDASWRGATHRLFSAARETTAAMVLWWRGSCTREGGPSKVVLLADPAELRGDAAVMFGKLPAAALTVVRSLRRVEERARAARSGSGLVCGRDSRHRLQPPVKGLYAEAIAVMNASQAPVVAVDIPSGADADAMGPQTGTDCAGGCDGDVHGAASRACV